MSTSDNDFAVKQQNSRLYEWKSLKLGETRQIVTVVRVKHMIVSDSGYKSYLNINFNDVRK